MEFWNRAFTLTFREFSGLTYLQDNIRRTEDMVRSNGCYLMMGVVWMRLIIQIATERMSLELSPTIIELSTKRIK